MRRICLAETATRFSAMAYVGWGAWTLWLAYGSAEHPEPEASRNAAILMTIMSLHAIGVGALFVWRGCRIAHLMNAAGVSCTQLGTCVGASYAWLPVGFMGPLLCGLALAAGALALLTGQTGRPRSPTLKR